jgi:uncharacterized membrane protein
LRRGTEAVDAAYVSMSALELDLNAASSTGFEPQVAGALAYLAGPFSGVLVLLAERTNRYVRFHAWQAIVGLGGLGVLTIAILAGAFLGLFISPALAKTLYVLAGLSAVVWLVAWGTCLVKAFGGSAWKLPVAGNLAERRVLR